MAGRITPMKLSNILANIDRLSAEKNISDRSLSLAAGMSSSGIRNWRRRLETEGERAGVNAESLLRVAQALGVSVQDILGREGSEATRGGTGFSEPQVEPWSSAPDTTLTADLVLRVFGEGLRRPAVFISRAAQTGLGISAGDILVADLDRRAEAGDTVLVTLADLHSGQAETLVRQYQPPFVISLDAGAARPVLRIDLTGAVAIMGVVTAIVRDTTRKGPE